MSKQVAQKEVGTFSLWKLGESEHIIKEERGNERENKREGKEDRGQDRWYGVGRKGGKDELERG